MAIANPLTVFRGDYRYVRRRWDVACLVTDAVGELMCVREDRINGKWRVQRADPTDIQKMPAIGVLIEKSTPTVGVIQWIGPCEIYTGLDWSEPVYWVGDNGQLSASQPTVGGSGYAWCQPIGKAVASDLLLLNGNLNMTRKIA